MSVSVAQPEAAAAAPPVYPQPFQCHICQSRFTRHENLKRHAAVHTRSADKTSFPCEFCQVTFSRLDLRHRHIKRKHPEKLVNQGAKRPRTDPSTDSEWRNSTASQGSKASSSLESSFTLPPQQPLSEVGLEIDNWVGQVQLSDADQQLQQDDQGRQALSFIMSNAPMGVEKTSAHSPGNWLIQPTSIIKPGRLSSFGESPAHFDQNLLLEPSSFNSTLSYHFSDDMQTTTGSQPIFTDVSSNGGSPRSYIPDGLCSKDVTYLQDDWFPTPSQTARGYQLYFTFVSHFVPFIHRPTFDATETARHLGLGMLCLAYQHGEDPDAGEQPGSGAKLSRRCFHRARVLAAAAEEISGDLLHKTTLVQTYWLLQVCVMMYLCGEESTYGLKMHSRMVSLARFGGLTQTMPVESATNEDLDAFWRDFIVAESHKRTLLAVHQIDALWYQLFSTPRLLSHLEIKHDLPCREEFWTASSSAQWAHRQLASKQSAPWYHIQMPFDAFYLLIRTLRPSQYSICMELSISHCSYFLVLEKYQDGPR